MDMYKKTISFKTRESELVLFKPLIFIDLEYITTRYREYGHRAHLQEIIELASIVMGIDYIEKYTKIVKPRLYFKYMNSDSKLKKITLNDIEHGVDLEDVIEYLKIHYKPNETKVISWGGADLFNINNLCNQYGIDFKIYKNDYIDLSQKFRRFYGLTQAVKLQKALNILGIEDLYEKHRALPDTEMLVKIFNKMVSDGFIENNFII